MISESGEIYSYSESDKFRKSCVVDGPRTTQSGLALMYLAVAAHPS